MDPRIAKTQDAVMRAAADLLMEQGPDGLTVDAVVARSGVAKSTVYRHWATRDELVAAVFNHCAPDLVEPVPDMAFEPALRSLAYSMVDILTDEHWRSFLPALMLLKSQMGEIRELESEIKVQQTAVIRSVLQRGIDEGVLVPEALDDLDTTMVMLVGPVLMAALTDTVKVDRAFTDRVVSQFLAYWTRPQAVAADAGLRSAG
jgi:AcrR family transcriptional regulator